MDHFHQLIIALRGSLTEFHPRENKRPDEFFWLPRSFHSHEAPSPPHRDGLEVPGIFSHEVFDFRRESNKWLITLTFPAR